MERGKKKRVVAATPFLHGVEKRVGERGECGPCEIRGICQ
jgi:hypothetical protein